MDIVTCLHSLQLIVALCTSTTQYSIEYISSVQFSSVQFSSSVVSDCLRPHESQCARPPCPSPTPGVYPNSCPLSQRCHPTISSSVFPFSSCPQSLPASGSFPVNQSFTSGCQSIEVSASASDLPMNTQDWYPLGHTVWISCSPRDSQEPSPTPQFKSINSLVLSFLYVPTIRQFCSLPKLVRLCSTSFKLGFRST